MLNQSAENHLYNYKYPLEKYTLLQNYLTEPTLSDDKSLTIYHRWINSWNSHYLIFAINNLYIKMINVKSSIIYCYCIKKHSTQRGPIISSSENSHSQGSFCVSCIQRFHCATRSCPPKFTSNLL